MPASAREFAALTVERHADGIVVLSFAVPDHRQNVLTAGALADLAAAWDELEAGDGGTPRGVVIRSARPGSFFAGADVERLEGLATLPPAEIERLCDTGRGLLARLSRAAWPSVAVIDGVCLGGGLELALACDLRIATAEPHTSLGLPEVKLGLLPGWGGTVRLPRLIGPGPAVEFAVSGEPVDGPTAALLGLVDACVPAAVAVESARRLVERHAVAPQVVADRRRRQAAPVALDPTERGFLEATAAAVILGRTGGHYPAPPAILRTILAGGDLPADAAGRLESRAFAELARTTVSAAASGTAAIPASPPRPPRPRRRWHRPSSGPASWAPGSPRPTSARASA
jgi:enoyl-CoA hydratase/carnithine racemase